MHVKTAQLPADSCMSQARESKGDERQRHVGLMARRCQNRVQNFLRHVADAGFPNRLGQSSCWSSPMRTKKHASMEFAPSRYTVLPDPVNGGVSSNYNLPSRDILQTTKQGLLNWGNVFGDDIDDRSRVDQGKKMTMEDGERGHCLLESTKRLSPTPQQDGPETVPGTRASMVDPRLFG
ncbi:hypothetical protein M8818_003264 [Zalaria obscura]|uniref:Uncharacterized protein n=1 Tax=Zalaria obscura TaxID=2024903 RepID=A0ACC3SF38_9PEZI